VRLVAAAEEKTTRMVEEEGELVEMTF